MADFKKRLGKMLLLGFKQMKDPYYQGFRWHRWLFICCCR